MIGDHLSGLGFGGSKVGGLGVPADTAGNPWRPGLVAYWPLDESAGSPRLDRIGNCDLFEQNGVVGTNSGVVHSLGTQTTSGGTYDLRAPNMPPLNGKSFTVATWARFTGGPSRQVLGCDGVVEGRNRCWGLEANYTAFTMFVFGSPSYRTAVASAPTNNAWYFVVGGYDLSTGYTFIQVNAGPVTFSSLTNTMTATNNAAFCVCGRSGEATTFGGGISSCAYWIDRLLNQFEVERLYNNGLGRDILVNP